MRTAMWAWAGCTSRIRALRPSTTKAAQASPPTCWRESRSTRLHASARQRAEALCPITGPLNHQRQQHHEAEPDYRDQRFHDGPRLERLAHGQAEELLDQPEPRIVDVREEQ